MALIVDSSVQSSIRTLWVPRRTLSQSPWGGSRLSAVLAYLLPDSWIIV
jgi:hypothetical protein